RYSCMVMEFICWFLCLTRVVVMFFFWPDYAYSFTHILSCLVFMISVCFMLTTG
ncbi:hypothetical protein BDC45DRAFT_527712, partial [Circinella umbellata]